MSFFILQVKAFRLQRKLKWYKEEKLRSIEIDDGKSPTLTARRRYYHFWTRLRRNIRKTCSRICCCCCAPNSCIEHFFNNLKTDTTFENTILKSAVGFTSGVILSYLLFVFFTFQLNFNLASATFFCTTVGLILTLGLAFSYIVRCVVLLLIPVFFSSRGRQALTAYAYILAITGPAKNTLNNMSVLTESLACAQDELQKAVSHILEIIKQPFIALGKAVKDIMATVKKIIDRLKAALIAIKRVVLSILRVFRAISQWLGSIINICNKKLGTPFQRCECVFEGAVTDCQAKLGPMFRWLCSIAYVTKAVCYIVKPLDYICKLIDFMGDLGTKVIRIIKLRLTEFGNHMKTIFYVSVKYEHTFKFDTNQSRAPNEVTAGIVTEIRKRTDKFIMLFDWMSFVFSFFFFFILAKVYYYRQKFLTSDRYDNHYITPYFRDLDIRRARMDQETVLPLHRREARKYITITSVKLVYNERLKLTKSAIFLGAWTLKMMIHMVMDYSLYWVLAKIHYHGRFQSQIEAPNLITLRVEGEGAVADIYKSTVKAFTPFAGIHALDAVPCLPVPIAPNMSRYYQIVSLLILCWIMVIVEPYGLRLRHVVMSYYHPTRAIQRTVWLYNNVLRARGNFLKFARRQLRRKVKGNEGVEKVTCLDRLRASCPLLDYLLGSAGQESCLMCAAVVRPGDEEQLIHCQRAGCVGRYCVACYMDLQNTCTVCLEPVEYGDPSDMDEEKDSSDENPEAYKPKERRHIRKKKPKKRKEEDSKDGDDNDGDDNDDSSRRDDEDDDDETELMSSSTDVSTDLSYSYQDRDFEDRKNDFSDTRADPKCLCVFRDVERQYRLQLATVQDFNFMDGYQGADYRRRPASADLASSDVYIPLHGSGADERGGRRITWDPVTLDNEGVRPRRKKKPRRRRRNPRMCHENFNPIRLISKCLMKVFSVRRNCDKPSAAAAECRKLVASDDRSTSDDSSGSDRVIEPHFTQSEQLISKGRATATRQASTPQLRTETQDDRALYCRTKSPRYGPREISSGGVEAFAWNEREASGGERVPMRELNRGYPGEKRREDGEVRLQSAFADSSSAKAVGRTPAGIHIPLRVASVGCNLDTYANENRAKHQKRKRLHNAKLDSSRNSSPTKNNYQSHSMHNRESQRRGTYRESPQLPRFDVPGASQRLNINSPRGGNLDRDKCCPPRTDSEVLMRNYGASSSDWPSGAPGTGLDGGWTTDLSPDSSSPRHKTTDHHVERAPRRRRDEDSWEYFDDRRPRGSESYDSPTSDTESPPTYDTSPNVSPRVMQMSTLYEGEGMRRTMQQLSAHRGEAVHTINEATRVRDTKNSRTQPIASLPESLPQSRREYMNRKYTDAHKKANEERMPESPTRSKPKENLLKYVLTGKSYSSDTESD